MNGVHRPYVFSRILIGTLKHSNNLISEVVMLSISLACFNHVNLEEENLNLSSFASESQSQSPSQARIIIN